MSLSRRWIQVGWNKSWLDPSGEREFLNRDIDWEKCASITNSMKGDQLLHSSLVVLHEYLLGNDNAAIDSIPGLVNAADEYFYGDWRNTSPTETKTSPPNPSFWRKHAAWADLLRETVVWLVCVDRWDVVIRLSAYPNDDISIDYGQAEINREWLLVLFGILSGKTINKDLEKYATKIRNGSKKREKLLLALLEAIIADDETAMKEASKEYFKYYRAVERRPQLITSKVAIDASILYHYARHLGRTMPVPKSGLAHLVILRNET